MKHFLLKLWYRKELSELARSVYVTRGKTLAEAIKLLEFIGCEQNDMEKYRWGFVNETLAESFKFARQGKFEQAGNLMDMFLYDCNYTIKFVSKEQK